MDFEDLQVLQNSWWPYIISIIVGIITCIRSYVAGQECPSEHRIDGKNVLLTGASEGIGLATAIELARKGGKIILTCRNCEKGKKSVEKIKKVVPGADVDMLLLDVSKMKDIEAFVKNLKWNKIDVLINNAAVSFCPFEKTDEGFELHLATNYLGPFLLSHLLLPRLTKAENGRILNVVTSATCCSTAQIHLNDFNSEQNYKATEAFGQSKLALFLFTRYFPEVCKGTNVTINAIYPGLTRDTGHFRNSPLMTRFFIRISVWPWMWLFLKTPQQAAQSILYAATDASLTATTGTFISDCEKETDKTSAVKNNVLEELLYKKTNSMLANFGLCEKETEETH